MILWLLKEKVDYLNDSDLNAVGIETVEELVWDVNFNKGKLVLRTGINKENYKILVENIRMSDYTIDFIDKEMKRIYNIDPYGILNSIMKDGKMEYFTAKEIRKYQRLLETAKQLPFATRDSSIQEIIGEIEKIGSRRLRAALDAQANLDKKLSK